MVLEMTFPREQIFQGFYHLYLHRILPKIARAFSKNPAAYEYLADSIMNFPDPEAFARQMEEAGLVHVEKYSLDFGITYLHTGVKTRMSAKSQRSTSLFKWRPVLVYRVEMT